MNNKGIRVISFGTDYMNEEQCYKFYQFYGEQLMEYREKLEKGRLEQIKAVRRAYQIYRYGRILSEDYG